MIHNGPARRRRCCRPGTDPALSECVWPSQAHDLSYWLTEGLGVPRRRLHQWLADLGDELTKVDIAGDHAYLLEGDLEAVHAAEPAQAALLLPAYDPWILGPGTNDNWIISPDRRALFSRGANPIVRRGLVTGTWRLRHRSAELSWFGEVGDIPVSDLTDGVQRLSAHRGHELSLALSTS